VLNSGKRQLFVLIIVLVRRFMKEELAPNHDKYEKQGKVDKETWQKLGSQGNFFLIHRV
jgi:hypothetical protein